MVLVLVADSHIFLCQTLKFPNCIQLKIIKIIVKVEYIEVTTGNANDGRVIAQDPSMNVQSTPGSQVLLKVGKAIAATTTTTPETTSPTSTTSPGTSLPSTGPDNSRLFILLTVVFGVLGLYLAQRRETDTNNQ